MYIPKVISTNRIFYESLPKSRLRGFPIKTFSTILLKNVYIYHLAKLFIAKQKVTVSCHKLTYILLNILERDLKAIHRYFGRNFNCSKYVLSNALL